MPGPREGLIFRSPTGAAMLGTAAARLPARP